MEWSKKLMWLAVGAVAVRAWEAWAARGCLPGGWEGAFQFGNLTNAVVELTGGCSKAGPCDCSGRASDPGTVPPAARCGGPWVKVRQRPILIAGGAT